ncbi:MAG: glycosyltransferase [Pseudomonadota bacterium]|nr:glycosyltransferase [Pseudomonadota bacterium]
MPLNKNKTNQIEVLFAATLNYLPLAIVTTLSIIDKLEDCQLKVHYLWTDTGTKFNIRRQRNEFDLAKQFLRLRGVDIKFYDVSKEISRFNGQNIGFWGKEISLTHYMYLLSPEIIPSDKVIYLDTDMIVNCNLKTVFEIDMGNHLIGMAAPSGFERIKDSPNSGFIVLNLDLMRREKTLDKIIPFGENLPPSHLCDQHLLYNYFKLHNPDRLLLLDKNYNAFPHQAKETLTEIKIIHFAGLPYKPWQKFDFSVPFSNLWWYYARQTPYYEAFVKNAFENEKRHTSTTALTSEQQNEYKNLIQQGNAFLKSGQIQDALSIFNKALKIYPMSIEALTNIGRIHHKLMHGKEAILAYRRILELLGENTPISIRGYLLDLEKAFVSWDTLQSSLDFFKNDDTLSQAKLRPFLPLSLPLTNRQLQIVEQSYVKSNKILAPKLHFFDFSDRKKDQNKLKIGFLSADFRTHPTGDLLGEFFELIDRKQFDLYLYDAFPIPSDPIHTRLYATTPYTRTIDKMNDKDAAECIFNDKIDVLIDLSSHTAKNRLGILTYQPAVAQATYSGFPGTCGGVPGLDYMLADSYVIPPDQKQFFCEKVKYLTPSYRVIDRKQKLPTAPLLREHLHFDRDTIVLCCFNSAHKYTPNYFDLWARILNRVPKAILWFYRQNDYVESNISNEFKKRDIPLNRIVFTDMLPHAEHLARYQVADLFLDTEDYNGHTTGAEALFMGCPMITCPGNTFASRVGGSMLTALEMEELIVKNTKEYEEKVVELCNTSGALKKLREKMAEKVKTAPLHDMVAFTRSFEKNCREMFEERLDIIKK